MRIIALAAAAFLVLPVAHAKAINAFKTGNDLLRTCTNQNLFVQAQCIGYIEGVTDAFSVTRQIKQGLPPCMPATTAEGRIQDAVVGYLKKNPADRTAPAARVVVSAITANWHCSGVAKKPN